MSMKKRPFLKKLFIKLGLHSGGYIYENKSKTWGTYDHTVIATRSNIPLYDKRQILSNLKMLIFFLHNTVKNSKLSIFFGSLTDKLYDLLDIASGRCHATFYGDSDKWVYGRYTNFLLKGRMDLLYFPDLFYNDALSREFLPPLATIIAIYATDSMVKVEFPLIGNQRRFSDCLFYSQLVSYLLVPGK